MDEKTVKALLEKLASGEKTVEQAWDELAGLGCLRLSGVNLDTGREHRTGAPEVIYAEKKEPATLAHLVRLAREENRRMLMTRLAPDVYHELTENGFFADEYHERARIAIWWGAERPRQLSGNLAIVTAGSTDLPVAEEALYTAQFLGLSARIYDDVGVAGLHRMLYHLEELRDATCIIAVAGMEGALPSVLAGLVEAPLVAVPTSVGYGASFGGITALLAMLNGCAGGVGVVNIDNGFGAALLAFKIIRAATRQKSGQ